MDTQGRVVGTQWYAKPQGQRLKLRQSPRLASWEKADHPDQVRLREYLEDTAELMAPTMISSGRWAVHLEVGLPSTRDLVAQPDLDNFALPLAGRLRNERLVSVWCSKRHAHDSYVLVAPAREAAEPAGARSVRTTASVATKAYKEQIRTAFADATELPEGPVRLQVSFLVSPNRNWLTLWKPTIDALDPLLGRTRAERDWHPKDGRITDLGLHVGTDAALGHDVVVTIAAAPSST